MMNLVLSLVLGFSAQANGRLEAACMKQMSSDPQREAICGCLQKNLRAKVKAADLALLADVYEGKSVAAIKLQKKEFGALAELDRRVAENCAEDPDWKSNRAKKK